MKFVKLTASLAAVLLLSSCGVQKADPFSGIDPEKHMLFYYEYDGETVRQAALCYGERSVTDRYAEILAQLRETDAKVVEAAESKSVPVHGLDFLSFEEPHRHFAWSDGYLYADDGTVYEFDADIPAILAEHPLDWERNEASLDRLPCTRELMLDDSGGWEADLLIPSGELPEPTDGVAAEIQRADADGIVVLVKNDRDEDWKYYREDVVLQVELDGVWYDVPRISPWDIRAEFERFSVNVPDGEEREIDLGFFGLYGEVPAGNYRMLLYERRDGMMIRGGSAIVVEIERGGI